ncbi:DUF2283 domain-containing protein [Candidatus Poribacteria bacterium]|nr:DUF2283 domain-containing protein [Candidatus Poribacteria bacterium]
MKIEYDPARDLLYLWFATPGEKAARTVTINPGVHADFNAEDKLIGIEVLDASEILGERVSFGIGSLSAKTSKRRTTADSYDDAPRLTPLKIAGRRPAERHRPIFLRHTRRNDVQAKRISSHPSLLPLPCVGEGRGEGAYSIPRDKSRGYCHLVPTGRLRRAVGSYVP